MSTAPRPPASRSRRLAWAAALATCLGLAATVAWASRDALPVRRALAEAGHLGSQLALAHHYEAERPGPPNRARAAR